jgi:DNA-binding CsgD family transcriptional regulator
VTHRAELFAVHERDVFERGRQHAGDELARLSRRQQELAACVAEGLSNDQIAERLAITEGTVANHIAQIMRRLGFTNRTHIAVWAVERGLYRSGQGRDEEERSADLLGCGRMADPGSTTSRSPSPGGRCG